MGCCNEPATALASTTSDPTQHVNYAKGMVLGVDDFTQEFAYLAGRDHWLAREAIGYGTLSGLRVFVEDGGADGPRLHVSAGTALTPSGRLVCVPADQCAVLNRWLAKRDNATTVTRLLDPGSPPLSPPVSPPASPGVTSGTVQLYLALCWADCRTRPVPIPGEPCRGADELMAPSRVADDFRLELRDRPPEQVEEDALRDFVLWLRANVQVVDDETSPPPTVDAWTEALRSAARPWLDAAEASPPLSPPASAATLGDYLADVSPTLAVARASLGDFLRVAFRFWVTELRPLWMAYRCHGAVHSDADCVLLAGVSLDVAWAGGSPTGAWQVTGSSTAVTIDQSARPLLAHQRLLQEWLLADHESEGGFASSSAAFIVAAADPSLANAQSLGDMGAGLLKNVVAGGTGTLSVAQPGTDFYAPGSTDVAVADGGTGISAVPASKQVLVGTGTGYALATLTDTPGHTSFDLAAGKLQVKAAQPISPDSIPTFDGLITTGGVRVSVTPGVNGATLTANQHVVVCQSGVSSIKLPSAVTQSMGRVYVVKAVGTGMKVERTGTDFIDDTKTSITLKPGHAATLVSGGNGRWYLIAQVS